MCSSGCKNLSKIKFKSTIGIGLTQLIAERKTFLGREKDSQRRKRTFGSFRERKRACESQALADFKTCE